VLCTSRVAQNPRVPTPSPPPSPQMNLTYTETHTSVCVRRERTGATAVGTRTLDTLRARSTTGHHPGGVAPDIVSQGRNDKLTSRWQYIHSLSRLVSIVCKYYIILLWFVYDEIPFWNNNNNNNDYDVFSII